MSLTPVNGRYDGQTCAEKREHANAESCRGVLKLHIQYKDKHNSIIKQIRVGKERVKLTNSLDRMLLSYQSIDREIFQMRSTNMEIGGRLIRRLIQEEFQHINNNTFAGAVFFFKKKWPVKVKGISSF